MPSAVAVLATLLAVANIAYAFLFSKAQLHELSSAWGEILFIVTMLAAHTTALYLLFRLIKQLSRTLTSRYIGDVTSSYARTYFKTMYFVLVIAELTITGIILARVLQILFLSSYHIGLLIPIMAISFTLATILMSLLTYRLLLWYKITRSLPLLLYSIVSVLIAVGVGAMTASNIAILILQQEHIGNVTPAKQLQHSLQHSFLLEGSSSTTTNGSSDFATLYDLRSLQVVVTPLRIGFVLFWFTSVLFLCHYSKRVGELKFWIIISLPLLSFLIGTYLVSFLDPTSPDVSQGQNERQSSSIVHLYVLLVVASVIGGAFYSV